jgi:hypothetical protein
MTHRLDPHLAAIERRLERASQPTAAPGLRQRVLAAVTDALHEKVPATTSGWAREGAVLSSPDVVAGTFFLVAVAAVLWGVVASAPLRFAPLTLDERVRIAGVADKMLGEFVRDGHVAEHCLRSTRADDGPAHPAALRAFDGHRLLPESL